MARDLTATQFRAAMERQGFRHEAIGFWKLPPPLDDYVVYAGQGKGCRRSLLAYMMKEWAAIEAREALAKK